jgi:5-methylcytosine-specific restriction endonuclease McrA
METAGSRKRVPLSKAQQVAIFRNDGWLCRWCGKPVIFAPAMKYLEREIRKAGIASPLAYYHGRWTRDGAPLLDYLGAVLDHIEAFSTGGHDASENLGTACNKCNAKKSANSVADHQKRHPPVPVKGKYGEPLHWDGLSTLFVLLAHRDPDGLTATEMEWLTALTAPQTRNEVG